MQARNILLKYHVSQLVHVYIWDNSVSIYTSYDATAINSVMTSTGMH